MKNLMCIFSLLILLGNQCATPMFLAQKFKVGLAGVARICAIKPTVLCSKITKYTSISLPIGKPVLAMPGRCMSSVILNRTLHKLHQKNMVPKEFNKFVGSDLSDKSAKESITYTIDEYDFIALCVQASKAESVDQKPLYALIKRITEGQKAQLLIKQLSSVHIQREYNYGEIKLTSVELTECLLNYIPCKGSLEAGPSGNGTIALRGTVWLNGKKRPLFCAPKMRQVITEDRAIDAIISRGVEIKGQKEISFGSWFGNIISSDVVKEFNQLVEKAEEREINK